MDRMIVIGGSEPAIWPDWIRLCTAIVQVCTGGGASVQRCYEPESSSGELRAGSFATVRSDSSTRLSVMLSGSSTLE